MTTPTLLIMYKCCRGFMGLWMVGDDGTTVYEVFLLSICAEVVRENLKRPGFLRQLPDIGNLLTERLVGWGWQTMTAVVQRDRVCDVIIITLAMYVQSDLLSPLAITRLPEVYNVLKMLLKEKSPVWAWTDMVVDAEDVVQCAPAQYARYGALRKAWLCAVERGRRNKEVQMQHQDNIFTVFKCMRK